MKIRPDFTDLMMSEVEKELRATEKEGKRVIRKRAHEILLKSHDMSSSSYHKDNLAPLTQSTHSQEETTLQAHTLTNLIRNPEQALKHQMKPLSSAHQSFNTRTSQARRTVGADSIRRRDNQWSPRMLVSLDLKNSKKLVQMGQRSRRLGSISNIDPKKNMT